MLTKECEYIQEQGYYTYILLEKVGLNNIDSVYWPDEGDETWFRLSEDFTRYETCENLIGQLEQFHLMVDEQHKSVYIRL